MGDKSPKSVQKLNSQKQAKVSNDKKQADAARQASSKQPDKKETRK